MIRSLIVLPTYDEAENIETMLRRLRTVVPEADILVVDDGSPDGTAALAESLARELGGIEVLRRPGKAGIGSAYRAGFRIGLERGYEAMVEMDCDFSHDPSVVPFLLSGVEGGADLCIGSRYVPGGSIPDWTPTRRLISQIGNWFACAMLGISVRDSTAGFRAYHRRALEAMDLDAVRADGYGFQVEMAYTVIRNGGRVVEIPIEFRDRVQGRSKMSWRIVVEALTLVSWWGLRDRVLARLRGRRPAS